jgi:hypothetical protein
LLGRVFDYEWRGQKKEWGKDEYDRRRFGFIFHMSDWLTDLRELQQLFDDPKKATVKDAWDTVFGFLIHVIPHLNAAGRLFVDEMGDPFAEAAKPAKVVK